MFGSKSKVVILIENQKVRAVEVGVKRNKATIKRKIEIEYKNSLSSALAQIKKDFRTSSVRLLLLESKTYLKLFELPLAGGVTRGLILEKASEVIPEKIEEGYFDWKQVGINEKTAKVQFLSISKDYLVPIQRAAQKAGLEIEAFEAPSFALARFTRNLKDPHLMVYRDGETILVATHRGWVYGSLVVEDEKKLAEKEIELKEFVKEKWQVDIEARLEEELDPVAGLALKGDIKGSDKKVLNLSPPKVEIASQEVEKEKPDIDEKTEDKEKEDKAETKDDKVTELIEDEEVEESKKEETKNVESFDISLGDKKKVGKKIILIGLIIGALLGAGFGGILFYKRKGQGKVVENVTPAPTQTEEAEPTPMEELKRSDLSVEVLNGSGVAGEAGKVKTFLEDLGYENVETGNADSFDYEEMEIAIKEDKGDYTDILKNDLKDEYVLKDEVSTLEEDDDFDVVITLGKE